MTKNQLIESIKLTYLRGIRLVEQKNHDYAREDDAFSNFRSSVIAGVYPEQAILVRVLDKISRISNLLDKKASVQDESIEDTLIDCINYMAILKAMLEEKK